MATIDICKTVTKHLANQRGHKLTRFHNVYGRKSWLATCTRCGREFLVEDNKCAAGSDPCPGPTEPRSTP